MTQAALTASARFRGPQQQEDREDIAPPLFAARHLKSDAEALQAAQSVADQARSGAIARDQKRQLPWQELALFTTSGLGAISIPRAYGGPELSVPTLAEVFRILAQADSSLAQIPQNQFGIIQWILEAGTESQKHQLLGSVLQGHRIGHGDPEFNLQDTLEVRARLDRNGTDYRISGEKFYSTGALLAHWVTAKALDDAGRRVLAFIPRGTAGLRVIDDGTGFGQRTTASARLVLDHVPVAAEHVIPIERALERPSIQAALAQLIQAAIDVGIARAAVEDARAFVRQQSRPWIDAATGKASEDPYTIGAFGHLYLELDAAETLLEQAAQTLELIRAQPITQASAAQATIAVAKAKALTTEVALSSSEKLFELTGSRATLAEHGLDRHWRNARTHTLHDPVRWKYHAIGNDALNGTHPARHSWI